RVRERYPSGQREQTVNLPANAFGGSNPPLSTYPKTKPGPACQAQARRPQGGREELSWLEHEPSKLGGAGSNPVSRSQPRLMKGATGEPGRTTTDVSEAGAGRAPMRPAGRVAQGPGSSVGRARPW